MRRDVSRTLGHARTQLRPRRFHPRDADVPRPRRIREHRRRFFDYGDDMHSIDSVTDEFGQFFERYEYADDGLPTVLSPSGSVRDETMANNTRMFTGRL